MRSLRSPRLAPAPLRRLSIALLTALTAALLVSGAALAQEESEAPNCANGVVIPEPENNPELVADCEALLAAAPVLIGEEGGESDQLERRHSDPGVNRRARELRPRHSAGPLVHGTDRPALSTHR